MLMGIQEHVSCSWEVFVSYSSLFHGKVFDLSNAYKFSNLYVVFIFFIKKIL